MRIPSGTTNRHIYFVAVDATDFVTRETGLTTFVVYFEIANGTATINTTPTTVEADATNMPGVYTLALDEAAMTTLTAGHDTAELALHITHASMAPVTRVIEIYRAKITEGNVLDVTATGAAGIDWGNVENKTTANDLSGTDIQLVDTVTTYTGNTAQTGDTFALANGATGFAAIDTVVDGIQTDLSNGTDGLGAIKTDTAAILADTGELQTDWADGGRLDLIQDIIAVDTTTDIPALIATAQADLDIITGADGVNLLAATQASIDAIEVDTGTSIPDTLAGIGTSGGAAISVDAALDNFAGGISGVTSGTTVVGTQAATTYANTSFDDGVYHDITHATNVLDVVYQFLTGGGTSPVSVTFNGYLASNNDTVTVSAWDHGVSGNWEAIGTIIGQNGTVDLVKTLSLYTRHIGTSAAELGKVYIRLDCTGTSPVLHVDQLFIDYAVTSRSVGYANGEVWIDTVSGVAGTEDFVNGVADHPALTLDHALTIATSLGLHKFWVGNGSTITPTATIANKVFEGHEWTLELNGQNIAETMVIDADVTGTSTGSDAEFEDCIFGTSSMVAYQAYNCSYTGTQTFSAAGDYRFINCQSGVPGSGSPTFALGTGDMSVEFRRWSGGMTLTGIGANDVITISGELGTINLSSATAGTVEISGTYKALTNASSGVTVNVTGAILGGDVATILADTNELQTDWADGGRLDLIQDIIAVDTTTDIPALVATAQADLDIITGADGVIVATGGLAPEAVVSIGQGTVTTGATTTSIPTSAFSPAGAVLDQFVGRVVLFAAATTTATLRGVAVVISGSSGVAAPVFTVGTMPGTPVSGDTFSVV